MNTYTCSGEELMKNTRIPLRVMPTEDSMYDEIAEIMADTIEKNGDKKTLIICPVGPIGQYKKFAKIVNERRISLKNCTFINMDEYLDDNDEFIDNPSLSFHSIMDRELYSQIDPELVMPPEQRLFPIPGREKETDSFLESFGSPELVLTGVGINGHIAFNEPPEKDNPVTDEEYRNIGTRCLDIARETIANNGANKIFGALDIFPKRCITLGMKQLLSAKKIKLYLYCRWQWGIMRKICLEGETKTAPASFLQSHPDSEIVITKELLDMSL